MARATSFLVIAALSSPAFADPSAKDVEEAKRHVATGTELYDENNFRGALVELQRAYDLAPSYKILFNIGQVDMELQDYAGALTAYTRYLREGGSEIPAERVAQVSADIERLKGRVGHVAIDTAPGAEITVDNISVGFAPLPEPLTVNTGRHTIGVKPKLGAPETRVVDVAGQQQLTVVLGKDAAPAVAPPRAEPVPPPPPPAGPPSKVPMIVGWTATGALAAASVVFALGAHGEQNDLAKLRMTYPVTKAQLDGKVSDEKRSAALADGFGIAAIVGIGVSTYLTLHYLSAKREALQVAILPGGAMIAGRF